ncbi:hypothetical protein B0H14DRAFT_3857638 [Mycena olivaceomarginata]|nr:hypothetical protein B0H14DRAFT_3857638 [Mycena olivaceomarginata]
MTDRVAELFASQEGAREGDTARDNEKPRSIDSDTATSTNLRGWHVGKERQSSPDIISISDSDDDAVQVVDSSSIEIVFRPEDGKVTLTMQHSRVERTVQLGIDFYLGYYLFKIAFPGTEQKNIFALDALLNSAFTLRLSDVMERIKTDTTYRNLLTPLDTEGRTGFLITGMRYIYPSSPGPVDPRTGKRGDDVVDTTMPYMAAGIRSTHGQKKLPASMVALGGTAVHSSLNEHRTGHHVQSKFEGNAVQEIYDTHILLLDNHPKMKQMMCVTS